MIQLFTIGFTGKPASKFFGLLKEAGVRKIVDTRVNNVSQLSGFAKGADLSFFAKEIGGMTYEHKLELAPTKDLLADYRSKKISWAEYEIAYLNLLETRKVAKNISLEQMHGHCLLCSEHTPEKCHRRLLAEYLKETKGGVEIIHLID